MNMPERTGVAALGPRTPAPPTRPHPILQDSVPYLRVAGHLEQKVLYKLAEVAVQGVAPAGGTPDIY
jgi:hypothetical protein